jgi:hypothetical protein
MITNRSEVLPFSMIVHTDGEVLDCFVNGEGVNSGSTSPPEKTGEVVALPTLKTT